MKLKINKKKLILSSSKGDGEKPKLKLKPPPSSSSSSSASSGITKDGNAKKPPRIIKLKPVKKKKSILRVKFDADNTKKDGLGKPKAPKIKVVPRIPSIKLKVFGDGYDSEAPDKEDEPLLEEGIVLRLMKDAELDYVRQCVESGGSDLSGINIRWKDPRRAVIIINNSYFLAKLVDLPTVLESHKSVDKKNIFKTIDVCQMLYAFKKISAQDYEIFFNYNDEDENGNQNQKGDGHEQEVIQSIKESYDSIHELHNDGIAPPMNDIRHNRFKPSLNIKNIEKIENKVEELLRLDEEAETVRLDLMNEDEYNNSVANFQASGFNQPASINVSHTLESLVSPSSNIGTTPEAFGQDGEEDEYGEADDEDGEEVDVEVEGDDEIDDQDIENMLNDYDFEADENGNQEIEIEQASEDDDDEDDDDDDDEDDDENDEAEDEDEETISSKQHNRILREEIDELEATVKEKEKTLSDIHNEILKGRVIGTIQKLKHELEVKKRQLKTEEDKGKRDQKSNNSDNDEEEDEDEENDEEDDGSEDGSEDDAEDSDEDEDEDEKNNNNNNNENNNENNDDSNDNNTDKKLVEMVGDNIDEDDYDDELEGLF
ncbi:TATA-binding protein-associated factor [Saccharomycopsis crataegensis]|uniref:TATA-binding protein-associated factor n=1 Tax=Saccharomycopsis crataegensis TaxID=43959 RepID=A0AAV5QUU6_9ASCO|nr:TATA-binding protein-associated factor [Saccharomycopsis crataegensis]